LRLTGGSNNESNKTHKTVNGIFTEKVCSFLFEVDKLLTPLSRKEKEFAIKLLAKANGLTANSEYAVKSPPVENIRTRKEIKPKPKRSPYRDDPNYLALMRERKLIVSRLKEDPSNKEDFLKSLRDIEEKIKELKRSYRSTI